MNTENSKLYKYFQHYFKTKGHECDLSFVEDVVVYKPKIIEQISHVFCAEIRSIEVPITSDLVAIQIDYFDKDHYRLFHVLHDVTQALAVLGRFEKCKGKLDAFLTKRLLKEVVISDWSRA
jgi:hypothetical protein